MPMFGSQWLANAGGGYEIDQSIRFNSADSAYLTRSPSSTGDQKKWTTSFWFKRCKTGAIDYLMTAGQTSTNNGVCAIYVHSDDTIHTYFDTTGSNPSGSVNARKFRDPSAWYHFIWAVDAVNTVQKIWVNGEELSLDAGKNPPNFAYDMNATGSSKRMSFATQAWGHSVFANIYAAEIHHLDGQYITDPTTFGEYNNDGVWVPKAFAGTYGTNGFYITGATAGDLGEDFSGNNNDFTSSGLTTADQVIDTPTNNFPTFSPINLDGVTLTDGNLKCNAAAWYSGAAATMSLPTSGKWYIETLVGSRYGTYQAQGFIPNDGSLITNAAQAIYHGAQDYASSPNYGLGMLSGSNVFGFYAASGTTTATVTEPDGSTLASTNEIYICHAIDLDNERYFVGTAFTTDTSVTWFGPAGSGADPATPSEGLDISAYLAIYGSYGLTFFHAPNTASGGNPYATVDFGQSGFTYTPPTGFVALSTANLPTPTIADGSTAFQTTLYTGDGSSTQTLTQGGNSTFNPDFIWIKNRSNAYSHNLNDAVRGYTGASPANAAAVKVLAADATDLEGLGDTITTAIQRGFVQSSTSNGFIVNKGTSGSQDGFYTNASGHTYAAWQWLAANGTATNEVGTITSTVSANQTTGFSIVRAASMAGSGGTIGHGLGTVPDMVIGRMQTETFNWWVWHQGLTGGTYNMKLNDPSAQAAVATVYTALPTSTLINTGGSWTNGNPAIFYVFTGVEGFSKFGSYIGNGSADGSFINTGFKPAFILFKNASAYQSWCIFDVARQTYNVLGPLLLAEQPDAETSVTYVDALSNGFKLRTTNARVNSSGATHIYMAFAEHPFGGTGVAPATAR